MSEQDSSLDNSDAKAPALADDVLPDTLHLMPVPNRPFLPGQVQPVSINAQEWGSTLEALAQDGHGLIRLVGDEE